MRCSTSHDGHAEYPLRLGHEWMGTVAAVGDGVDRSWIGRRVTGDTMLGCGVCRRCVQGNQHVCEFRNEVGIRNGFPGALAEQLAMPVTALHALPDTVDAALGRARRARRQRAAIRVGRRTSPSGDRALVLGPGTIGLLVAMFARSLGAEVHLIGRSARSLAYARTLGFDGVWSEDELPGPSVGRRHRRIERPRPSGHGARTGRAGRSRGLRRSRRAARASIDTRTLALKDVTAVGILSASPGLAGTIEKYASGEVDPRPLVAATVGLDEVGDDPRRPPPRRRRPRPQDPRRSEDLSRGSSFTRCG